MKNLGVRNPEEFARLPMNWLLMLIDQEAKAVEAIESEYEAATPKTGSAKKSRGKKKGGQSIDRWLAGLAGSPSNFGVGTGSKSEASFGAQLEALRSGNVKV